ncbi:MAG: hypothetical protein K0S08_1149 [Gammaproteobacteria bacterium]|jgi:hypothetical protein|nr:hypothetical protein [Gammaproteobacteria bacterium]
MFEFLKRHPKAVTFTILEALTIATSATLRFTLNNSDGFANGICVLSLMWGTMASAAGVAVAECVQQRCCSNEKSHYASI